MSDVQLERLVFTGVSWKKSGQGGYCWASKLLILEIKRGRGGRVWSWLVNLNGKHEMLFLACGSTPTLREAKRLCLEHAKAEHAASLRQFGLHA